LAGLPRSAHVAFLLAGLVTALTIRYGTFAAWGTDQAGYIESSHMWTTGDVVSPVPLGLWPALGDRPDAASPLAFRPGVRSGTEVSWYPLGYPILMAAAERLLGGGAPNLVAPALAGLMVWCIYTIAARGGGGWAGFVAALLIAVSPVTLGYAVMPMSDVPAAALWSLAWVLSFRRGYGAAIAAGASSTLAMMVRPHLAPLAMVPLLVLLHSGRPDGIRDWAWKRGLAFVLSALFGPILVAWSQAQLYGDFRMPGYPAWESFFSLAHVSTNVWLLPKHLTAVHTPLVFTGLLSLTIFATNHREPQSRLVILSAFLIVVVNYVLYLPYLPYDDAYFVRFMLPALMALCVLNGFAVARVGQWLARRRVAFAVLAAAPVAIMLWYQAPLALYASTIRDEHSRIPLMGRYLREVLPSNAVVFCALQSGGVAHYTRAEVLRFDLVQLGTLDSWIDRLKSRGYEPVMVMDEIHDQQPFRAHAVEGLSKYRWMPRAEFRSTSTVHYMVPVRRDRLESDPGIVDVLH